MNARTPIYDVFLSYSSADAAWAAEIEGKFVAVGLGVYNVAQMDATANMPDMIWEALAESSALVALVTSNQKPPALSFEIGAAMAWKKPVYVIWRGAEMPEMPGHSNTIHLFREAAADSVIELVASSARAISDEQRRILIELFLSMNTPLDRMFHEPQKIDQITRQFNRLTKSSRSGETVLRELLRLRKRGALSRPAQVPRARRQPA